MAQNPPKDSATDSSFPFKITLRKLLKIALLLFLLFAVVVELISNNHPIILKWLEGAAVNVGKPIQAIVYTDGKINKDISVFHNDKYWDTSTKANNYLLSLTNFDSSGLLKYININLNEMWIGRPLGTSNEDYDLIAGRLFQSETGGSFIPFQDDVKGFNFNPHLSCAGSQIKFNVPPKWLKFDSIRIELK